MTLACPPSSVTYYLEDAHDFVTNVYYSKPLLFNSRWVLDLEESHLHKHWVKQKTSIRCRKNLSSLVSYIVLVLQILSFAKSHFFSSQKLKKKKNTFWPNYSKFENFFVIYGPQKLFSIKLRPTAGLPGPQKLKSPYSAINCFKKAKFSNWEKG